VIGTYSISPEAVVGENNTFGDGVKIGPGAVIGDNNIFQDGVIIAGRAEIANGNYFGHHVLIGALPENSRHKFEFQEPDPVEQAAHKVVIGNRNVIREFTSVNLPTEAETRINNDVYVMQHCAVAHDVLLEDNVILSNHCSPGGHAKVLKGANLGKGVQTHQRTVIGQYAMLGVGAVIVRNVLPGVTSVGNPAKMLSTNTFGLERAGFDADEVQQVVKLLTAETGTVIDQSILSDRVLAMYQHFYDVVLEARDNRTIPQVVWPIREQAS
jgi:UDP-N-acetylglucosamine acyltransferase